MVDGRIIGVGNSTKLWKDTQLVTGSNLENVGNDENDGQREEGRRSNGKASSLEAGFPGARLQAPA